MIPIHNKEIVEFKNDIGLTEAKEVTHVSYYQSNNRPQACKGCRFKKDKDLTYTMNLKRTGSAYCADCAKEHFNR